MQQSPGNIAANGAPFDPASITRPDEALLRYYTIIALMTLFGFPFTFIPLYCRYRTLRYSFDDKGVSMKWGVFFHREIYLTYRRIQDIHVSRNLIHRWLGLSSVAVQTASGSSGAEMTIEGVRNPEVLRDYLYAKMRGAKDDHEHDGAPATLAGGAESPDETLALLHEIRDELRAMRSARGG